MDGRAAMALAMVGLLGVALGAGYLWRARANLTPLAPPAHVAAIATPAGSVTDSAGPAMATGRDHLVVDVAGKVRRPGVITVPAGSRVVDALRAVGGAQPGADTSSLNLARLLTDGEQVLVGVPVAQDGGQSAVSGAAATTTFTALLDLNTATAAQLEELPGVGPVLAQRILDWRREHGRFTSVDELREVTGIGERRFAELRSRVRI